MSRFVETTVQNADIYLWEGKAEKLRTSSCINFLFQNVQSIYVAEDYFSLGTAATVAAKNELVPNLIILMLVFLAQILAVTFTVLS